MVSLDGLRQRRRAPSDPELCFPPAMLAAVKSGRVVQPEPFDEVTVFVATIVGLDELALQMTSDEVDDLFDRLFSAFDALASAYGIFKISTGADDSYMVVAGLPDPSSDHCENLARFALAAVACAKATLVKGPDDMSLGYVSIRAGLATGRCVASVIGRVNPRFALFGEASAMASRLESHGMEDRIHISKEVATRLELRASELYSKQVVPRGSVLIRGELSLGLGRPVYRYLDLPRAPFFLLFVL